MRKKLVNILWIVAVCSSVPTLAFAATEIDLTPVANNVINAVSVIALGLAGWVSTFVVGWFSSKTKVEDQAFKSLAQQRLSEILYAAIRSAEAWAKAEVNDPKSSIMKLKIDNVFVGMAVKYAVNYIGQEPGGLWSIFDLTEEKVKDMIINRLNDRIGADESEPATEPGKQLEVIE